MLFSKQTKTFMPMIVIYVYFILLAVYLYEFHKMFSAVYTKRISTVIPHVMMFAFALVVLYQLYVKYISFSLMWEEFTGAFIFAAAIGAIIALGGIFIHLRAYFYPQYR